MKLKGLRWWVVGLIAAATVINYIDRQALGVLWPDIAADLYPNEDSDGRKEIYSWITGSFIFFYAIGQALFGKIFDWIGTRLGFAISIGVWSIATALHAFAGGAWSFAIFRSILGLAEAGNWPGAAKGNAEWFPTQERAFAQGLFNSGAAIGGIIAIPAIGLMTIFFSWKIIFIVIGLIGLLWLIPWFIIVKAPPKYHPNITEEERNYILNGQKIVNDKNSLEDNNDDEYNPSTGELIKHRESWGVVIASAAIDPIWWLFVVWIPIYLNGVYDMDVKTIAIYGWVPYVGAMLGAWFGGLLAQNRIKSGWNVNKTRKWVISLGCIIMFPSFFLLMNPGSPTNAVIIMAFILFGFQTAIGNVQTLPSDLFGKNTVGTLAGIAGMAAKFGAFGLTILVPIITAGENYTPAFYVGAALTILALFAIWFLIPKIEPLKPLAKN
ncbi:MFS transporter [Flavobacteriaceae bacterium]|nr:MFS transporter [Flavobacteriaceae bacterium]